MQAPGGDVVARLDVGASKTAAQRRRMAACTARTVARPGGIRQPAPCRERPPRSDGDEQVQGRSPFRRDAAQQPHRIAERPVIDLSKADQLVEFAALDPPAAAHCLRRGPKLAAKTIEDRAFLDVVAHRLDHAAGTRRQTGSAGGSSQICSSGRVECPIAASRLVGSAKSASLRAAMAPPKRLLRLARLAVGIDNVAGLVLVWGEDRHGFRFPELLDIASLNAVILHPDGPRLGPFAVRAEGDLALDRLEGV